MFMFCTTPYVIIIALILVLLIAVTISLSFIYYTKRKYDTINEYYKHHSKKGDTYKKAKKKLNKDLGDLGLVNRKFLKTIKKMIHFYNLLLY